MPQLARATYEELVIKDNIQIYDLRPKISKIIKCKKLPKNRRKS